MKIDNFYCKTCGAELEFVEDGGADLDEEGNASYNDWSYYWCPNCQARILSEEIPPTEGVIGETKNAE